MAVRETVRRLCQSEHQKLVVAAEENETLPRDVFARWGELGLLGVRYPESDGGSGLDKISDCIVREELSYMSQGFASSWSAHSHLGIWPIWKAGTEAQRRALLPARRAGPEDRGLCPERTRWRLEHPRPQDARRTRRRRLEAQRQQALHHQRADRGFPAGRGADRARTQRRRDQPVHRRAAGRGHEDRQAEEGGHPCLRDRPDPHRRRVRARTTASSATAWAPIR